jgi:hypothetical protein
MLLLTYQNAYGKFIFLKVAQGSRCATPELK